MAKGKSMSAQFKTLRRVMRYIKPQLPWLLGSLVLSLVSVALTLYIPILVGRAVDCIVSSGNVDFAGLYRALAEIGVCHGGVPVDRRHD